MRKFGRNYILSAEGYDGKPQVIGMPHTVEFDINRALLGSSNTAKISVYNLNENTRSLLYKDQFDFNLFRSIELRAGYGNELYTVFKGNVGSCSSERNGVNYITRFECFDGQFALRKGDTKKSYEAGTSYMTIISAMVDALSEYGISKGKIGYYPGTLDRGNQYVGNPIDIINEITDNALFIDNGQAHVLRDEEVLVSGFGLINSDSGLLGPPRREGTNIIAEVLFEPRIQVGQKLNLQSESMKKFKDFNGIKKVMAFSHRAMISEAESGPAVTTLTLSQGTGAFVPVL